MVLGTSSGAGKSWITTALCRHYANQGLKVAPFKAQNMSNNARVVAPALPAEHGSLPAEGAASPSVGPAAELGPPRSTASPVALPPEGAASPWGGPAAEFGPPRSTASPVALPPGGAASPWGGPAAELGPPRSTASPVALPPEGAASPWGAPAAKRVASGDGMAWGEIGSAQYFQALAARAVPDVRMNPLLLKPEADTRSQVVLMGQAHAELSALPWRGRSERVWPQIAAALDALRAENDVVMIEGAGSPAEINLMASDVVNLRVARHADARCLLVADIDRGGAFAHLYGTWALLPEADRARIAGFVLNKFRGDASLLAPAPQQLQQLTGVPTLAVVPMRFGHGLPEEDGVFDDAASVGFQDKTASGAGVSSASSYVKHSESHGDTPRHIAIVAYPRLSNLDEFQPLKNVPGLRVSWARTPAQLAGADTIILPGSKATLADLAWLRAQGLDAAVADHAARGGRVLGICGGLQMLGEALIDMDGVESAGKPASGPGLGLLPLVTAFAPQKTVRRSSARFGHDVQGAWARLAGVVFTGYEIHSGQTAPHPAMAAQGDVAREVVPQLAWQNPAGNVLGCYVHGLFEDAGVLHALFGAAAPSLDDVFDGLAGALEAAFAPGALAGLIR
ncbi:cobyric acid synthase [Ottowia oryzae]